MSMRIRQKTHQHLYPKWGHKEESPARKSKRRDGLACVDCGTTDRTLVLDENGSPSYLIYLHAAHVHALDPDFKRIEPIEGQRMRARCPRCHRIYDLKWEAIEQQLLTYRQAHACVPNAWYLSRFCTVL